MAKPLRLSRRFSESFKHTSLDHTLALLTLPPLTMERANIIHSNEKFHQQKLSSSCIVTALMPRKTFRYDNFSISRATNVVFSAEIRKRRQSNRTTSALREIARPPLSGLRREFALSSLYPRNNRIACQRAKFDPTQIRVFIKLGSSQSGIAALRSVQLVTRCSRCRFLMGSLLFHLSSGLFHFA